MHPTDLELIRYARDLRGGQNDPADPVAVHAAGCETCREELEVIRDWLADTELRAIEVTERSEFEELVLRLLRHQPTRIEFVSLEMPQSPAPYALAADGIKPHSPGLQHRATLYSEHPEVILRVMHDPVSMRDILQLTAEEPALTNHVYIRLVDPPMEFLTDARGTAEVPAQTLHDPAALAWSLQLPDATFSLRPLEASRAPVETLIDLPAGDQIAVSSESDATGLSLRVRPVRIHGRKSFERVRVVVCQPEGRWQAVDARASGECVAANLSADSPIEIRLFVIE